ncbi:zinc-binding dehydrogenase [Brevibacterium casei]|uniref:NADPH2:quinone reductase n=2 Tax=Brevibacterium casei TaxID=33889 RepID=A0A2H1IF58_9MICO|nr:zinc-binding dehydrogenase [Brevibacterium casei]QPR40413.1 zinc-binding dehydrogenase [Brevibacterium casei]QPR44568.1 zinc-binding dehydrogenase [Brevibacterium casei]SMX73632.1 NADPH2:quinone reductase [Brevibacterium casei CIP 102111]VEW12039.1 Quinone oxidoreductase 1 [Brevibacterium casei]
MRAVIADRPGTPDVLHPVTLPDPAPGPEQVRVAVEAAATTFIDTLIRSGSPVAPRATFPVVLGNGVGGLIDRVGSGVDPAWIGTRVVTTTGGTGGYASLALAHVADLHRVPELLDLPEAAALLADGRTAVGLHDAAGIRPGETVVITAAAGGVGSILTQLAKVSGAHVIALAGNTSKLDHARSLGADTVVNYRDLDWTSRLRAAAPGGLDVVFDGIGTGTTAALFALVRSGGRYVQHGAAGGSWGTIEPTAAAERNVTVIPLDAIGANPGELFSFTERALDLAARGTFRPTIGQTFPLDDAAAAHAAIGSRATTGKTLLLP